MFYLAFDIALAGLFLERSQGVVLCHASTQQKHYDSHYKRARQRTRDCPVGWVPHFSPIALGSMGGFLFIDSKAGYQKQEEGERARQGLLLGQWVRSEHKHWA